jgi:SulP family sulfate permease
VAWNRVVPRVPGYIVALVGGTAVAALSGCPSTRSAAALGDSGRASAHSDSALPARPDPHAGIADADHRDAGRIESLLSAVVADRMSGTRHNSNVELFAQGMREHRVAAGWRPSGDRRDRAQPRPTFDQEPRRRSPGIIHALTLLLILLFAAPLARMVPMAVLAAILLVVAYNMGEWAEIPELWKQGWTDRLVWMVTVRADRPRRPDGRRRSGDDPCRTPVHPPRRCDDHSDAGVTRLHQAWP